MSLDLIHLIGTIGYPGLALIIFLETGTLIGFLFPGSSLLFTAGLLAASGFLNIWILVPIVTIAAILGDAAGYWFGGRVGPRLFDRPDSRFYKRAYLEKTREFYARYGVATIVIGRFLPFIRTFAPILAGVVGMPYRTFLFYNILGGIAWGSGVSLAGYIIGEAFPRAAEHLEYFIIFIIGVTVIPFITKYFRAKKPEPLPSAIVFDLDGTLALDFQPPSQSVIHSLEKLLELRPVAIASAAQFERIESSVLSRMSPLADREKLFLFPLNGTRSFLWKEGAWEKQYDFTFESDERERILKALKEIQHESPDLKDETSVGEKIRDYGSYISFSCIGFGTPGERKSAWDPNGLKRARIIALLTEKVSQSELYIGGRTTIDVVPKNINKAYAVRWLASHLNVEPASMLFVGDAIYPGGNDYVVVETGIKTHQVRSVAETEEMIGELLSQHPRT